MVRQARRVSLCLALFQSLWANHFRYAGVKGIFEELDGRIRRHLRNFLWRQWKRPFTRAMRPSGNQG